MHNVRYCLTLFIALTLTSPVAVLAQQTEDPTPFVFAGSTDIGHTLKGSTLAGPKAGSFRITGGGADMWGTSDDFHLNWIRLTGDATLTADVHFQPGAAPLAKGVLIFRQNLSPGSAYADVAIHGDGHVTLQYRATEGEPTKDITAPEHGTIRIRISRTGDRFNASTQSADGTFTSFASQTLAFVGPIYLGLGVCAHNAGGLVTVTFTNVTISHAAQLLPVQR